MDGSAVDQWFDECRTAMRQVAGDGHAAVELVSGLRVGRCGVTDAALVYPPTGTGTVAALDAVLDSLASEPWRHQVVEVRRDAQQVVEVHLAELEVPTSGPGAASGTDEAGAVATPGPVRCAVLAVTCTAPGFSGECVPLEECLLVAVNQGRDTAVVRVELDEPSRYQQSPRYHPVAYRRFVRIADRLSGRDGGRRATATV